MRTTALSSTLAAVLWCGCLGGGPDEAETQSITLTAEDVADGALPRIDLTGSTRWVIDGTVESVHLDDFEVETPSERMRLGEWLESAAGLDDEEVEALGTRRLQLGRSDGLGAAAVAGVGANDTGDGSCPSTFCFRWGRATFCYDYSTC